MTTILARLRGCYALFFAVGWVAQPPHAQEPDKPKAQPPTFFDSEDPLTVTLTANFSAETATGTVFQGLDKPKRDRLFRGFCTEGEAFPRVFALFNEKRAQIYALYGDPVGNLLDRRVAKETLKYFDQFYRTINDSRSARRQILQACTGRP